MITKEKYLDLIKTKEVVENRAYEVSTLLNKLNSSMWGMYSDSGEMYFYDDSVSLNTHDYFRGSYDSTSMDFNSDYLFMSDDEIIEDANRIIEFDKEKTRQIKENKDKLLIEQTEEKERIEYERLKNKYHKLEPNGK
jgi:hypothetical protein